LIKSTSTNARTIVGVCVGGQYVNSSSQTVQAQYIPASASTAANPAYAYVVDDQQALFKVAVVTSGTTMGTASRADVGSNVALVLNAGYYYYWQLSFRCDIDWCWYYRNHPNPCYRRSPEQTATAAGVYCELLVKINAHQYNNTTGV
jgi:hypothetical protein